MSKYRFTLHYTAQFWAVLVTIIGSYHFLAWFFGDLASQGHLSVTMKTNASLCFLLSGLCVFFIQSQKDKYLLAVKVLSSIVFILGTLTFLENLWGWNFGIDELLAKEPPGALGVIHPNRMGIPASFSFALTGGALFAFSMRWGNAAFLSQITGCIVILIGLFGFMGYGYSHSYILGVNRVSSIAFISTMNLIFLGTALLIMRPFESMMKEFTSHESGKELMRRYLLPFIVIALFTGYFRILGEKWNLYDTVTGTGLRTIIFILLFSWVIYRNAKALNKRESSERLAREELSQKEKELQEAQRIAHIGSWYLDARTLEVKASPEAFHIQGLEPTRILPAFRQENRNSFTLTQESWERISAAVQTALKTGASYEMDLESRKPNGTAIWFTARGEAVYDREGKIAGLRGTVQDITDRKKDENALRNFAAVLEKRVDERTKLLEQQAVRLRELVVELTEVEQKERRRLAEVLHDHLQQYLVAVKMRLEIAERKSGDIDKAGLVEARLLIEKAVEASRVLTAELRPPVLYEGGLAAALRFLAQKLEGQHQMKVNLHLGMNIEPASDFIKVMIYQCVQELLFNAVKYSGVNECMVKVERFDDKMVYVKVRDEGVGFEPSRIGKEENGGFGLFSIRERVKALGGELTVTSSPGQGSLFTIKVPDREKTQIPSKEMLEEVMSQEERDAGEAGRMMVLIADDHQIVRQSIASLLKSQPFIKEVVEAENGEEAVMKAENLHPDVVLMDLNMPVLNGIEATKILHHRNPELKIIGLSVQSEFETAKAMKEVGAYAYFNKAGDTKALIETIKSLA